jgi:hypothetical protein
LKAAAAEESKILFLNNLQKPWNNPPLFLSAPKKLKKVFSCEGRRRRSRAADSLLDRQRRLLLLLLYQQQIRQRLLLLLLCILGKKEEEKNNEGANTYLLDGHIILI